MQSDETYSNFEKPLGEARISVRIPEAIRMTGIGRSKIYELIASGDIEAVKVGRCTLIKVESLHNLVNNSPAA